jgi:hypothetical protein
MHRSSSAPVFFLHNPAEANLNWSQFDVASQGSGQPSKYACHLGRDAIQLKQTQLQATSTRILPALSFVSNPSSEKKQPGLSPKNKHRIPTGGSRLQKIDRNKKILQRKGHTNAATNVTWEIIRARDELEAETTEPEVCARIRDFFSGEKNGLLDSHISAVRNDDINWLTKINNQVERLSRSLVFLFICLSDSIHLYFIRLLRRMN